MGELHRVLQFVFRKQLRPVIDRVYPLSETRAGARAAGEQGAVREDRPRAVGSPGRFERRGLYASEVSSLRTTRDAVTR